MTPPRSFAPAALALLAGGCAAPQGNRFPSLLPRAIETRSDAEPEAAVMTAEPDPALDVRIAALSRTVDTAADAFAPAANLAERRAVAARGDPVGGERWIAAQTALAELDGFRATTSAAVTDIEELAIARAAEGKPDYPALATAQAAAQAALDAQTGRIGAISARLPGS